MGIPFMKVSSSIADKEGCVCRASHRVSPQHTKTVTVPVKKLPNPNPNPNPYNFRILRHAQEGRHLVVEILYPDCTNYEGRKICVYHNTSLKKLKKQSTLDPHFCGNRSYTSPFARFRPTKLGWDMACDLALMLRQRQDKDYDPLVRK